MALSPTTYTNNGPAVTTSPHYLIDGDSTDGTAIAPNAGPVSFYGVTPVTQRASSVQATSALATSSAFGATQLAYLQEVGATLQGLGLWKGGA
jgi:hypothetical protein